jgi:hypothetical protein
MRLFSEYVAWQNYAATQLVEHEVEETRAEADVRRISAEGLVLGRGGKVTETKAEIATSDVMQRAQDRVIDAYAKRKVTGIIYANCERVVNLLSRELTRRVGRETPERRMNRWSP